MKLSVGEWFKLKGDNLQGKLKEFLGSDDNIELLTAYVTTYAKWAEVVDALTHPETGKNIAFKRAQTALDRLKLTEDQIRKCLETKPRSGDRRLAVKELKEQFPDRTELIDKTVVAYDEYKPFEGRLDDPADLKRMLKGAGILEWRILPTSGHPDVDADQMNGYMERLRAKGPKDASDSEYRWCEIEEEKQKDWIQLP